MIEGNDLFNLIDTRLKEKGVSWRSTKFQSNDKASIKSNSITLKKLNRILDIADLRLMVVPKSIN